MALNPNGLVKTSELDPESFEFDESAKKIKVRQTPQLGPHSNEILFTNDEVTLGDFFINGGGFGKFIFRKLANSNKIAVCTGFEYGGEWYLDRPDDGEMIDPLDGMKRVQVVNGEIQR